MRSYWRYCIHSGKAPFQGESVWDGGVYYHPLHHLCVHVSKNACLYVHVCMYACIHVEVWEASTFPPTLRPFSANYIMGNSRTNFAIRNLLIIFTRLADCNKRYFYNIALVVIIVTQLWNRMKAPSRNSTWPSLHLSTAVAQHARKMADKVNKEEPGLNEAAIPVPCSQFQRHSKSLLRIEISLADRPSQAWHKKTLVSQVWIPSKSFLPRLRGFYVLTYWRSEKCCQMLAKTIS